MITSKASWPCFMCRVSLGLQPPTAMPGRTSERPERCPCQSHTGPQADSMEERFTTSCRTPPSPAPMISTSHGMGWLQRGRLAIISRWENSSLSVHWMTPANTSMLPQLLLQKTRIIQARLQGRRGGGGGTEPQHKGTSSAHCPWDSLTLPGVGTTPAIFTLTN